MNRSLGSSATGRAQLRKLVVQSPCKQGVRTQAGLIVPLTQGTRTISGSLHRESVRHNVARSRAGLEAPRDPVDLVRTGGQWRDDRGCAVSERGSHETLVAR